VVRLIDRATAPARRITDNFADINNAVSSFDKANKTAAKIDAIADKFDNMGKMGRRAVEGPLSVAASLEEQLSVVQAKSGATAEQLNQIKARARELGANTKHSALEAAGGFEVLSAAGLGVEEQLNTIDPVLTLATAGFVKIDKAAKLNTDTLGAWGLGVEHAAMVTDQLVGAANTSKQTMETLGQSLKYAGPAASEAGAGIAEVLAMQGQLARFGVTGGQAGRGLRAMFKRLQDPTKTGKKMLRRLHVETLDGDGNLRSMGDILADLDRSLDAKFGKGKGGGKRKRIMGELFGSAGADSAAKLMGSAVDGSLQKMVADIESYDAKAAAALAGANTKGAMAEAKSAFEELQIVAGDELLPTATELLKTFTGLARATGAWAQKNTGLVRTVMLLAGGLALIGAVMAPVLKGVAVMVRIAPYIKTAFATLRTGVLLLSASFRTLAASLFANPITWVVAGIVALIAAGYLLWRNWDQVGEFFRGLWDRMPGPVQSALRLITAPIRMLVAGARWLGENWGEVWGWIRETVGGVALYLGARFEQLTGYPADILAVWRPIGEFFSELWEGIASTVTESLGEIVRMFVRVGEEIEDFERSVPEWMTGRDRVVAGGAFEQARAIQAAANGGGYSPQQLAEGASGLASTFGGSLRITLASEDGSTPTIASSESNTGGNSGITLDTGYQGAA
jgi:TP901 family phage tail tape measure protein